MLCFLSVVLLVLLIQVDVVEIEISRHPGGNEYMNAKCHVDLDDGYFAHPFVDRSIISNLHPKQRLIPSDCQLESGQVRRLVVRVDCSSHQLHPELIHSGKTLGRMRIAHVKDNVFRTTPYFDICHPIFVQGIGQDKLRELPTKAIT